jgi:DNA-directed RNA polymerase subunit RPC12/RpoP
MAQNIRYVNCPHCGQIIEVVSPYAEEPRKVTASRYFSLSLANTRTQTVCQHCGNRVFLHWYEGKK